MHVVRELEKTFRVIHSSALILQLRAGRGETVMTVSCEGPSGDSEL